jgi:hypothetical protein
MARFTEQERMELIDIVEILDNTLGTTSQEYGVTFERIHGMTANGVRYSDSQTGDVLREMSSAAYASEFFKLCEGSLGDANFDKVLPELTYVGNLLGGLVITSIGVDGIRTLATDEAVQFARNHPIDDGDYC